MNHLYARLEQGGREVGVLMVDLRLDDTPFEVAERLYHEHPLHLIHADAVVVRRGIGSTGPCELGPFRKRAPKAALYVLSMQSYEITCSRNRSAAAVEHWPTKRNRAHLIEWLRQRELEAFVLASTALFRSSESVVYKSPSGRFCRAFLRAGSVQRGRHQIDALSFWLLPHVKDIDAIVADTWSISSATLNTIRLATVHDRRRRRLPLDFEILTGYQDGSAMAVSEAAGVLLRASDNGRRRVLALISTVMTGASAGRLRRQLTELGVDRSKIRFATLYALGPHPGMPALCDLSRGLGGAEFGAIEDVSAEKVIIDIDKHTYFPLHIEERSLDIRKGPVKAGVERVKAFFTDYQGIGAIALHRDANEIAGNRLRHHAYYVDVERMLASRVFIERLRVVLERLSTDQKVIVVPPHKAGLLLAQAAQGILEGRFGSRTPIVFSRFLDLDEPGVPTTLLRSLNSDDEILLVDDVSVTGFRLAKFQTHLRSLFSGRINYLIGVARPESERAWIKRTKDLAFRDGHPGRQHQVLSVETLLLPDWDNAQCPWCSEERALEKLRGLEAGEDLAIALSERLRHLVTARLAEGMVDNAVWRLAGSSMAPRLTENSVFLPRLPHVEATDADVFGSVASVLQLYRKAPGGLQSGYPLLITVSDGDYLGTTFTDAVLRIAFLRAAKQGELAHWKTSLEQARTGALRALLTGAGIVEPWELAPLTLECASAILTGKLSSPEMTDEDWSKVTAGIPAAMLHLAHKFVRST